MDSFDAWYDTHDPRTPQSPFDRELARKAWDAAMQSAEVQALRDALQSIVDCCDEDHAARDYSSRQTEMRGIARCALAQGEV